MFKRTRKMLASILAALMLLNTVSVPPASADGTANDAAGSIAFTVVDEAAEPVVLPDDAGIVIEPSQERGDKVEGIASVSDNTLTFTPNEPLTEDAEYKYTLSMSGYEDATGTFMGNETQVDVVARAQQTSSQIELGDAFSLEKEEVGIRYAETLNLVPLVHLPSDYDGEIRMELEDKTDAVEIDGTTIIGTCIGEAAVLMTAPETEKYLSATKRLVVTVLKIDLGEIGQEHVQWNEVKETYTQSEKWPVSGTLTHDALLPDDKNALVQGTAVCESKDAGSYSATVTEVQIDLPDYYAYTLGEMPAAAVTILPVEVQLEATPVVITKGDSMWTTLKAGHFIQNDALGQLLISGVSDELMDEFKDAFKDASIRIEGSKTYAVGTYEDAVTIVLPSAVNNNFTITASKSASLTVTREVTEDDAALWEKVRLNQAESSGIFIKDGSVYVGPKGIAVFGVKDGAGYDSVAISVGSGYSNRILGSENSGNVSGSFYLYDSENPATRTDAGAEDGAQDNAIPDGAVIYDAAPPSIALGDEAMTYANGSKLSEHPIQTFLKEKGEDYRIRVVDNGSGVKNAYYALLSVPTADASMEDVFAAITDWTAFDKEVTVNLFTLSGGKDGAYCLLIKAEDEVGNTALAMSDIVLFDTVSPAVEVLGITEEVYRNDVAYEIKTQDKGDAASGLAGVIVAVKADGNAVAESGSDTEPFVGSFSMTIEQLYEKYGIDTEVTPITMSALLSELLVQGLIPASLNSDAITITVTVTDRAGNAATEEEKLSIDASNPVAVISYTENNPANERFFNDKRTMQLTVRERSFSADDIQVVLTVNGIVNEYTLTELMQAAPQGISYIGQTQKPGTLPDEAETVFEFLFGEDGSAISFAVSGSMKDKAGNTAGFTLRDGTKAGWSFVVDKEEPTLVAEYVSEGAAVNAGETEESRVYLRAATSVTLTVKDTHFNAKDMSIALVQKNSKGEDISVYNEDLTALVQNEANWAQKDGAYRITLPAFEGEVNYALKITASDMAGNTSASHTGCFTVDKQAPSGEITVGKEGSFNALSGEAAFRIFSGQGVDISITGGDEISGINSVKYHVYRPDPALTGTFPVPHTVQELETLTWTDAKDALTILPNAGVVIYARIEDRSGNVTFLNTKDGIICDNMPPVITVDGIDEGALYGASVPVSFKVDDPSGNGIFAGLKDVGYVVKAGGAETQKESFSGEFTDETKRTKEYSGSLTIDAAYNNSNAIVIEIYAEDYAGNRTSVEHALMIDTSAPKLTVSYDNNSPVNGYFFSKERTMTLTAKERNFDEQLLTFTITVNGKEMKAGVSDIAAGKVDGVTIRKVSDSEDGVDAVKLTDNREIKYELVFGKEDGADYDFSVAIFAEDLAGNQSGEVDFGTSNPAERFVVDKTNPYIMFEGAAPKDPVREDIEVAVTLSDAQGDAAASRISKVTYRILADGAETESGEAKVLTENGKVRYVFTVNAARNKSNDLMVEVTATDMAGNRHTIERSYMVDVTPPAIEFKWEDPDFTDGCSLDHTAVALIKITERNFSEKDTVLSLTINEKEEEYPVSDILAGKVPGISLSKESDTQAEREAEALTDERVVTYKLSLGTEDGTDCDYIVQLKTKDLASNKGESAVHKLTVDMVTPGLTISDDAKADIVNGDFVVTLTGWDNGTVPSVLTMRELMDKFYELGTNARYSTTEPSRKDVLQYVADSVQYTNCADFVSDFYSYYGIKIPAFTGDIDKLDAVYRADADAWQGEIAGGTWKSTLSGVLKDGDILNIRRKNGTGHAMMVYSAADHVLIHSTGHSATHGTIYKNTYDEIFRTHLGKTGDSAVTSLVVVRPFSWQGNESQTGDYVQGDVFRKRLKTITATVYSGDAETQSFTFEDLTTDEQQGAVMRSFTLSGLLNDSNDVRVVAKATDYAGNSVTVTKRYKVDLSKPELALRSDDIPVNGQYFNQTRTLELIITERNFEESQVFVNIAVDGGAAKEFAIRDLMLNAVPGIRVVRGTDSQSGLSDFTNERRISYFLYFGEAADADHDYALAFRAVDLAGNASTGVNTDAAPAALSFAVDRTAPELAFASDAVRLANADVPISFSVYDSGDLRVLTRVSESGYRIFCDGKLTAEGRFTDYAAEDAAKKEMIRAFSIAAKDNNSNHISVEVYALDMAGNRAQINRDYAVDITAPKISLTWDSTQAVEGAYYDTERTGTLSIKERNFTAEGIAFTIGVNGSASSYSVRDIESGKIPGVSIKRLGDSQKETGFTALSDERLVQYALTFGDGAGADYDYTFDASVTDEAGNTTASLGSAQRFTVDKVAPALTINTPVQKGMAGDAVRVSFSANDNAGGKSMPRLKSIDYVVMATGTVTQQGSFTNLSADEANAEEVLRELIIDAALNNSNDIVLQLTARDFAGHAVTEERRFQIDKTAPVMTASFDRNDPLNGRYFNHARIMTLSVKERNFNEEALSFEITIDGEVRSYSFRELADGKASGVSARMGTDTQAGLAPEQRTDERVITFIIGFGEEGGIDHDYVVGASVTDAAGNGTNIIDFGPSTPGAAFTIDEVAPVLSLAMTNESGQAVEPGLTEGERLFSPSALLTTIRVTERNFTETGLNLGISGTNAAGAKAGLDDVWVNNWMHDNTLHAGTVIPISENANYALMTSFTDLAGNSARLPDAFFTVDTVKPTGTITINAEGKVGEYGTFSDSVRFVFFTSQMAKVTHSAGDETSGVAEVAFWVYNPPAEQRGEFAGADMATLERASFTAWDGAIELAVEQQAVIYARIRDRAGNTTYISSAEGVVIDKTSPLEPVITISIDEAGKIFSGDVPFTITVTDPVANGTFAGLQTVEYEILNGELVTQSGNYNDALTNPAARVQTLERSESVTATLNNSNHVTIRVRATDYAGNTASAEKQLRIDITPPVIRLEFDQTDGQNGQYYSTPRTATITVRERNFDPALFTDLISTVLGKRAQFGTWSLARNMGESDGAESTVKVTFTDDDDYSIGFTVTDMAGNTSSFEQNERFTIDRTAPVISITFDKNKPENERFYNGARTATITVTDKNFDPNEFALDLEAYLAGEAVLLSHELVFAQNKDAHTAVITLDKDGDYTLAASARDKAGNVSETVEAMPFTIDQTAPELSILGVEDRQAYNSALSPAIRFSDINAGNGVATVTLKGLRHPEVVLNGILQQEEGGSVLVLEDIEDSRDADDIYTMTAAFRDLAGNETVKSITFSINRFGSNFSYDEQIGELLETFYLREGKDIVVFETNVDTITHSSISVGINGQVRELVPGEDYLVEEVEGEPWKVYKYTVLAKNFAEEGVYEIIISSVDGAGNAQDNKLKEAPISFAVDKTAPSCVMTGAEEGAHYNDTTRVLTVNVSDNLAVGGVRVYVNEQLVREFSAKEVAELGGKLPVTIMEGDDFQSVYAIARDAAGSETRSETVRLLVSTNFFVRFYRNTPLFVGSIAGVTGALFGIIFFLWKRRRKKEEEKARGTAPTSDLMDPAKKGEGKTADIAPKQ